MRLQERKPKRDCTACSKYQNLLGSVDNIGESCMTIFNAHKNLHFNNEWNVYTDSKTHKESDYGLDLDMLTILY